MIPQGRASSLALLLFISFIQGIAAHYAFPALILNGSATERWQYVRNTTPTYENYDEVTNAPGLYPIGPMFDPYSEDIRCGRNGSHSGPETHTTTVAAGSEIGFKVWQGPLQNGLINHNGPAQVYMSKPTRNVSLEEYQGDGEWFKIAEILAATNKTWLASDKHELFFTIPPTTPTGKYLLRIDHLNLLDTYNATQYYANCAHVNVVGPGGGKPGPLVKFPGAYDMRDPSILVPTNILFPDLPGSPGLLSYKPPGPAVWKG